MKHQPISKRLLHVGLQIDIVNAHSFSVSVFLLNLFYLFFQADKWINLPVFFAISIFISRASLAAHNLSVLNSAMNSAPIYDFMRIGRILL